MTPVEPPNPFEDPQALIEELVPRGEQGMFATMVRLLAEQYVPASKSFEDLEKTLSRRKETEKDHDMRSALTYLIDKAHLMAKTQ